MTTTRSMAWRMGYTAAAIGIPRAANPFRACGDLKRAWRLGWSCGEGTPLARLGVDRPSSPYDEEDAQGVPLVGVVR